jgi:hypothetical protein
MYQTGNSNVKWIKQTLWVTLTFVLWGLVGALLVFAQAQESKPNRVEGIVIDGETGETLPSAHVVIESTYRGTITNADGHFSLKVHQWPVTLSFRFIGYETREITLNKAPSEPLRVVLQPRYVEMDEVVVTGEDPAVSIMRKVIEKKQQWRAKLQSYQAQAYTRMILSSDSAIASISESITTAYWDKEKGHREVVKAKKQTANMTGQSNFAGVNNVPNFYDNIIDVAGFKVIGPTHPEMLKFYDVSLEDFAYIDDNLIYEIELTPKRKLQPLFVGTIHVMDDTYAMVDVDLKPNEVISFPKPVQDIQLAYGQQFSDFGGDFWLPVDMRIEGSVKVGLPGLQFPRIGFKQVSTVENYEVNIPVPDSLYKQDRTFVEDSSRTRAQKDSLWERNIQRVPLTQEEELAYQEIDSTSTMEEAFKPTGPLARFIDMGDEEDGGSDTTDTAWDKISRGFQSLLRYSRVEEGLVGLRLDRSIYKNWDLLGEAAYSTGLEKWSYGAGFQVDGETDSDLDWQWETYFQVDQDYQGIRSLYPQFLTGIQPLLGYEDYFDYYRKSGIESSLELDLPDSRLDLLGNIRYEKHESLTKQTDYDILGRDFVQRPNPPIQDGYYFRYEVGGRWGNSANSFGVTGHDELAVYWSQVLPLFNSDLTSSRVDGKFHWTFDTFYQRRLLPNQLDVTLSGGWQVSGTELPQYFSGVDGSLGIVAPTGTMRSFLRQPVFGADHLGLMVEHHFRSIPFEAVGFQWAADRGWGLSVTGGATQFWNVRPNRDLNFDPEKLQLEAGVSWQGLFGLFRVDATRNFTQDAWFFTIGLARLF